MTLADIERAAEKPRERRISSRLIRPEEDPQLFDEWLSRRKKMVSDWGWKQYGENENDYDEYDTPARHTSQIVLVDDTNKLIAGMRLTPVNGLRDSLSWKMLGTAPSMYDEIKVNSEFDDTRSMWDLTRLIPAEGETGEMRSTAVKRLFGEGLRLSRLLGDNDPTWIFTVDVRLARLLKIQGITIHTLAQGRINPEDKYESVFGFVQPAFEEAKNNEFSRIAMNRGDT